MSTKSTPIDGTWELIKAEMAGERAPDELSERTRLKLENGCYWVYFDGEVTDRGTFSVSDDGLVKLFQLVGTDGQNSGRRIPCIYQQAGDRLRVCYGIDQTAPTEFTTARGQMRYLATYRRYDS